MRVYRLSKLKYSGDLTGRGAEMSGGRWNSKGSPNIYTSDSIALSRAEIAVRTILENILTLIQNRSWFLRIKNYRENGALFFLFVAFDVYRRWTSLSLHYFEVYHITFDYIFLEITHMNKDTFSGF